MAFPSRLLTLSPPAFPPAEETKAFYLDGATFLTGPSSAMSQLLGQIRRVAPYFRTAMLTGERCCGEEAAARALHRLSPLQARPFVILSAAEAERRLGGRSDYEPLAGEGMFYIPQPERLPPSAQKALLRMLRDRGSQGPRVAAFAERGLRSLVSAGTFSAELADSLGALRIALPPLRDRSEDIPDLFKQMVHDQAAHLSMMAPELSPELLQAAAAESWPGNFEQVRVVALGLLERGGVLLHPPDLQAVLGAMPEPQRRDRREIRMVTLDRVIHEHVRAVLFACNGNKLRAAEVLGISRSTLYRMLESEPASSAGPPALPEGRADGAGAAPHLQALRMAG